MKLSSIFVGAVALRWAYAGVLYALLGEDGLKGPDSFGYLAQAHDFVAAIISGKIAGWGWLAPSTAAMPVFMWLITLHVLLFGSLASLSYVLMQGIMDAGTCL